jgi:hypothetical protein
MPDRSPRDGSASRRSSAIRASPASRGTKARVPQDDQLENRQRGPDQRRKRATAGIGPAWNGTEGARIWTGQAVLAHSLVKIGHRSAGHGRYPSTAPRRSAGERSSRASTQYALLYLT